MSKWTALWTRAAIALRRLRKAARGTVGIGTMIVFIASVLVAAIAAAVLIDTSSKLQERSARTGNEATEQVSSNIGIYMLIGRRDTASSTGLTDLDVYLSLSPGSRSIDLSQLRVQLKNGTVLKTFDYVNAAADADSFNTTELRDADNSFTSATPVMTSGDLAKVTIDLTAAGAAYKPRNTVTLVLIPEIGNKVVWGFKTPASYGTDTIIDLS